MAAPAPSPTSPARREAARTLTDEVTAGHAAPRPGAGFWNTSSDTPNMGQMLSDVEPMMAHPRVEAALSYYTAGVAQAEFAIEAASSDECGQFALSEAKRFWQRCLSDAQRSYEYGRVGGELVYTSEEGPLRIDYLKPFAGLSALPLVRGKDYYGVRARSNLGVTDLPGPSWMPAKGFWHAHNTRYSRLFGFPQLYPAWRPWRRLAGRDGAEDIIDGAVYRFGVGSPVGRYPMRDAPTRNDWGVGAEPLSNRERLREMMEYKKAGAPIAFPSTRVDGYYEWDLEDPDHTIDVSGMVAYNDSLESQITLGIGVAPELLEASEVGSGYSGRAIPLEAFLVRMRQVAWAMLQSWWWQVGHPLLLWNYGPGAWARLTVQDLLKTRMKAIAAASQPEQQQAPADGRTPVATPGRPAGAAAGQQGDAIEQAAASGNENSLKATVGGSQAIAQLQKDVKAGAVTREQAIANATIVFAFSEKEAERLFPDENPGLTRFATDAAQRSVGDKWQGPSGKWFTKRPDGRVVPTADPDKAVAPEAKGSSGHNNDEDEENGNPRDDDEDELSLLSPSTQHQQQFATEQPPSGSSGDPWQVYQGKRGGKGWKHTVTGRIVYGEKKPGAGRAAAKPPVATAKEKPARHKAEKADPKVVADRLRGLLGSKEPLTADDVRDVVEEAMTLTVPQIKAMLKEKGLTQSGVKADLVGRVRAAILERPRGPAGSDTLPAWDTAAGTGRGAAQEAQLEKGQTPLPAGAAPEADERAVAVALSWAKKKGVDVGKMAKASLEKGRDVKGFVALFRGATNQEQKMLAGFYGAFGRDEKARQGKQQSKKKEEAPAAAAPPPPKPEEKVAAPAANGLAANPAFTATGRALEDAARQAKRELRSRPDAGELGGYPDRITGLADVAAGHQPADYETLKDLISFDSPDTSDRPHGELYAALASRGLSMMSPADQNRLAYETAAYSHGGPVGAARRDWLTRTYGVTDFSRAGLAKLKGLQDEEGGFRDELPAEPKQPPHNPKAVEDSVLRHVADVASQPENRAKGGVVTVPELVDRLQQDHPGMTREAAHQELQRLADEDKIHLGSVNDPHLEPRSGEMIQTPRGLYGYVSVRGGEAKKEPAAAATPTHEALTSLNDLYDRALTPHVTTEGVRTEVTKLRGMNKADLIALAKEFSVTLTPQEKASKEGILKALGDRIIDRKGDYERSKR